MLVSVLFFVKHWDNNPVGKAQCIVSFVVQYIYIYYKIQSEHSTSFSVRKQYIDLLNSDPRKAISQYDYEIDQMCGQLLNSEKTFVDLRGSQGTVITNAIPERMFVTGRIV